MHAEVLQLLESVLYRNHSAHFEHISQREICENSAEAKVNHVDIGRLAPEGSVVNSKTPVTGL